MSDNKNVDDQYDDIQLSLTSSNIQMQTEELDDEDEE